MTHRLLLLSSVCLPVLLGGCELLSFRSSDDGNDRTVIVQPGTPFELAVGDRAVIATTSLELVFAAVEQDSRCPLRAQCVWAGEAHVRLTLVKDQQRFETLRLFLPGTLDPPPDRAERYGYVIRFLDLAPYPETGPLPTERYQGRFVAEPAS